MKIKINANDVASYIVEYARNRSHSGNYIVFDTEIATFLVDRYCIKFNRAIDWINDNREALKKAIDSQEAIIGETYDECDFDESGTPIGFDIIMGTWYCPLAE